VVGSEEAVDPISKPFPTFARRVFDVLLEQFQRFGLRNDSAFTEQRKAGEPLPMYLGEFAVMRDHFGSELFHAI